jgi:branched-chain amino acid transport system substrate-binding protein
MALASAAPLAMPNIARAQAQDVVRVGVINHITGPFATAGEQIRQGIDTYLARFGAEVGGRRIEYLHRDIGGPNPATSRRLAEELVVRDRVNILTGFYLTSDASAAAAVVNQARIPAVLAVAASPALLPQSPWFVRMGQNIGTTAAISAVFARGESRSRAYIAVADYAPGHDVQSYFKDRFTREGGTVVGEVRIPLNTVDFAPFAERIANANPDCVIIFVPPGAPALSFIRALSANGIMQRALVMGSGEAEDSDLHLFDDQLLGFHQILYYGEAVDNPQNVAFKAAVRERFGANVIPNFATVSGHDCADTITRMVAAQTGPRFDAQVAMTAIRGASWASPRGPLMVDAETREIIHNIYARKAVREDGRLRNVVVATFPAVRSAS